MKPVFGPSSLRALGTVAATLATLCALAGCGQRGPLYLPVKPHPVPATTSPIPTAPLPEGGSSTDKDTSPASR